MDDEDDDFAPWTPDGADQLLRAAEALVEALRTHAAAVAGLRGDGESGEVVAAGERLVPALLGYADAQFQYTGSGFPLGIVHEFDDDDSDEVVDEGPVAGVSVLRRDDYVVDKETAVLKAGRKAYRRMWPEDDAAAATADVTHLGRALYLIAHADGWDGLRQVKGLRPVGGITLVHSSDELLGADPDTWPEGDLFRHDEERLLYREDDVYTE